MLQNDHDYPKATTPPSHLEGQESSDAVTASIEVPTPSGKGLSTPPSKAKGPTERVDPSIFELVHILGDSMRLENFLIEHGLGVAPPPPLASSSANGTPGVLEKRGPGRKGKPDTPVWGVCSELGFNPDLPWCKGKVITSVRKSPRGGRHCFRCRFCRKQLSQLHGLPWAKPPSSSPSSSPASKSPGSFFCNTDSLGRPNARVSKRDIIWIVYCMSKGMSSRMTAQLGGSEVRCGSFAGFRWRHLVREAVSRSLAGRPRLGGAGKRVQVAVFTVQLKWSTGKRPSLLLALQAESTGELRLVPIEDKAPGLVAEAIATQVLPETQIMTNGGTLFSRVEAVADSDGPMRLVHNAGLRDDDTSEEASKKPLPPFFNTQKLRVAWRYALTSLKEVAGIRDLEFLKAHLDWLSWISLNGARHCKDPFLRLLDCIAKAYES
ncbi:uncharacterized protein LOC144162740 isoform X2 [Haemaphysalis longicornis]